MRGKVRSELEDLAKNSSPAECVFSGLQPSLLRRFGHPLLRWTAILLAHLSEEDVKRCSSLPVADKVWNRRPSGAGIHSKIPSGALN